jgi:hypothetical protein
MAQYGNLRLFIIFTIIYIQAKIIFLLSYNNKSYFINNVQLLYNTHLWLPRAFSGEKCLLDADEYSNTGTQHV